MNFVLYSFWKFFVSTIIMLLIESIFTSYVLKTPFIFKLILQSFVKSNVYFEYSYVKLKYCWKDRIKIKSKNWLIRLRDIQYICFVLYFIALFLHDAISWMLIRNLKPFLGIFLFVIKREFSIKGYKFNNINR